MGGGMYRTKHSRADPQGKREHQLCRPTPDPTPLSTHWVSGGGWGSGLGGPGAGLGSGADTPLARNGMLSMMPGCC
eukprot:10835288-Alexandrium_andersonii.AAC.1